MKVEPSSARLHVNFNININCKENGRVIDLDYVIVTLKFGLLVYC